LDSRFPELDALYRDIVLDHFRSPRGRKPMADADIENRGLNPVCGDDVLAELLVGKTREEIEGLDAAFRGLLHGEPLPPGMDVGDLAALEGVRHLPVRVKCALLAWTTLHDALKLWDGNGAGEAKRPEAASTTEDRA
jgi:nitrogen fixation NifU-like protein